MARVRRVHDEVHLIHIDIIADIVPFSAVDGGNRPG
jgi:hypothetical protein